MNLKATEIRFLFLFDALSCSCYADTSFITWGQRVSIQPFGLWAWHQGNRLQMMDISAFPREWWCMGKVVGAKIKN
jgi:type IV secretory pathway TraG/TraD family ATPase VirD4